MNMRRVMWWGIAAAALAMGGLAAYALLEREAAPPQFASVDITGADWGRGFELADHHGARRTLADFRGKVVLLFFGYTQCPDVCPTTLALLGETLKTLGADANEVQGLFMTVDPKRDTPQVLAQYVPAFYPSFLGLYADQATTKRTVREFKGYFHANPPNEHGSYTVDHTGQVYVFDREGRLRLYLKPDAMTPESIARDLRTLLHESVADSPSAAQLFGKQELLQPEQAFRISARALDERNVEVEFRIADGYYMYRDRFSFATESGKPLADVEVPRGKLKEDQFFGKTETFRRIVRMRVPVPPEDAANGTANLKVTSQGCSDKGVCYVPLEQFVKVTLR